MKINETANSRFQVFLSLEFFSLFYFIFSREFEDLGRKIMMNNEQVFYKNRIQKLNFPFEMKIIDRKFHRISNSKLSILLHSARVLSLIHSIICITIGLVLYPLLLRIIFSSSPFVMHSMNWIELIDRFGFHWIIHLI